LFTCLPLLQHAARFDEAAALNWASRVDCTGNVTNAKSPGFGGASGAGGDGIAAWPFLALHSRTPKRKMTLTLEVEFNYPGLLAPRASALARLRHGLQTFYALKWESNRFAFPMPLQTNL